MAVVAFHSLLLTNLLELLILRIDRVLLRTCLEKGDEEEESVFFLESLLWSCGNSHHMWVLASFPGYRVTGLLRASGFFPACLVVS